MGATRQHGARDVPRDAHDYIAAGAGFKSSVTSVWRLSWRRPTTFALARTFVHPVFNVVNGARAILAPAMSDRFYRRRIVGEQADALGPSPLEGTDRR
jgi:hypothetical protein